MKQHQLKVASLYKPHFRVIKGLEGQLEDLNANKFKLGTMLFFGGLKYIQTTSNFPM